LGLVSRERVLQAGPAAALDGFPVLRRAGAFFRAARHAPWWFCRCGGCRFDLEDPVEPLMGTLYAGTDEVSGVMETIGPELVGGTISRRFLADRTVWMLSYDRPLHVAELASPAAVGLGVTNELASMTPYAIPQAWASALHQAGWDGISYRTRFNTGSVATGLALFDLAGSHPDWPAEAIGSADAPVIVSSLAARGIAVDDPPPLAALSLR